MVVTPIRSLKSFTWGSVLIGSAVGCASPYLRQPLFVVEAADAELPVMLSKARSQAGGRRLHASSATRDDYSRSSEAMGTFNGVAVSMETTTIQNGWSLAAAWPQLKTQILPDDRWLQITSIEYTAVDERDFASSSAQRSVHVEAVAK